MPQAKRTAYHHGNLPVVLLESAIDVLNERGPEGFSLREVARRADVAVAAPGHHFGNIAGLLTAVAIKGFQDLCDRFDNAVHAQNTATDGLVAICEAYLKYYSEEPGTASVLFRWDALNADDQSLFDARGALRMKLRQAVANSLDLQENDALVENTSTAVWAVTHGFVALKMDQDKAVRQKLRFAVLAVLSGARQP